jgi:hypothetical protein
MNTRAAQPTTKHVFPAERVGLPAFVQAAGLDLTWRSNNLRTASFIAPSSLILWVE